MQSWNLGAGVLLGVQGHELWAQGEKRQASPAVLAHMPITIQSSGKDDGSFRPPPPTNTVRSPCWEPQRMVAPRKR